MRPEERFSSRQLDYDRGRPRYPEAAVDRICEVLELHRDDAVIELGSGTGILTEPLLRRGLRVTAIEPNSDMREVARSLGIDSLDAHAEKTGLPDRSARAAIAAQAFHWFDIEQTRAEMKRVLEAPHRLALLWNTRDRSDPATAKLAETIDRYGKEVATIGHQGPARERKIEAFFDRGFRHERIANPQQLDWESLRAFLGSASYLPAIDSAEAEPLVREARAWHEEHAVDGHAPLVYVTDLYWGALAQT
jgi:SAM-dependent methyltransferase